MNRTSVALLAGIAALAGWGGAHAIPDYELKANDGRRKKRGRGNSKGGYAADVQRRCREARSKDKP